MTIRINIPAGNATTVLVNGAVTVDHAEHTGALAGKLLDASITANPCIFARRIRRRPHVGAARCDARDRFRDSGHDRRRRLDREPYPAAARCRSRRPIGTLSGHLARAQSARPRRHRRRASRHWRFPRSPCLCQPVLVSDRSKRPARSSPTWNYVAIHAHGTLRFIDDLDWKIAHVTQLHGRSHEAQPRRRPGR